VFQNEEIATLKGSLETTRSTLSAMSAKSNALREEKKELSGECFRVLFCFGLILLTMFSLLH
jgi:hypothetical protein